MYCRNPISFFISCQQHLVTTKHTCHLFSTFIRANRNGGYN